MRAGDEWMKECNKHEEKIINTPRDYIRICDFTFKVHRSRVRQKILRTLNHIIKIGLNYRDIIFKEKKTIIFCYLAIGREDHIFFLKI